MVWCYYYCSPRDFLFLTPTADPKPIRKNVVRKLAPSSLPSTKTTTYYCRRKYRIACRSSSSSSSASSSSSSSISPKQDGSPSSTSNNNNNKQHTMTTPLQQAAINERGTEAVQPPPRTTERHPLRDIFFQLDQSTDPDQDYTDHTDHDEDSVVQFDGPPHPDGENHSNHNTPETWSALIDAPPIPPRRQPTVFVPSRYSAFTRTSTTATIEASSTRVFDPIEEQPNQDETPEDDEDENKEEERQHPRGVEQGEATSGTSTNNDQNRRTAAGAAAAVYTDDDDDDEEAAVASRIEEYYYDREEEEEEEAQRNARRSEAGRLPVVDEDRMVPSRRPHPVFQALLAENSGGANQPPPQPTTEDYHHTTGGDEEAATRENANDDNEENDNGILEAEEDKYFADDVDEGGEEEIGRTTILNDDEDERLVTATCTTISRRGAAFLENTHDGDDDDDDNDNDADASVASSSAPKGNAAAISSRATAVPSYRKYGWLGLVVLFLLTGLTTAAILLWQRYRHVPGTSSSSSQVMSDGSSDNDTMDIRAPTVAPTVSMAPTVPFPYTSRTDYYETLLAIVFSKIVEHNTKITNTNEPTTLHAYHWTDRHTAQYKAVRFVTYIDGPINNGIGYYYTPNYAEMMTRSSSRERQQQRIEQKLVQRLALLLLYYETGGEFHWLEDIMYNDDDDYDYDNDDNADDDATTASSGTDWIRPGIDECEWVGVTCDPTTGFVTELDLYGRDAVGTIPLETWLWLGRDLEVLDVSFNRLRDDTNVLNTVVFLEQETTTSASSQQSSPSTSYFPKLRVLDLSHNDFTGTIAADLRDGVPSLQVLRLSANAFTGLLPCHIQTDILQEFWVDSNQFSGTLPLEQWFASIPLVSSSSSFVDTIDDDAEKTMSMEGNIRRRHQRRLHEEETTATVNTPTEKEEQPQIGTYNNLARNGHPSALRVLDVSNNALSGTIPRTVLMRNIDDPTSSSSGPLDNLEVLDLHRNGKLLGTIPTEIGFLTKLEYLQLSDCDFEGRIPLQELFQLPNLEYLIMPYNRLTGTIPATIILETFQSRNPKNNNNNNDNNNSDDNDDGEESVYSPLNGLNIGHNRMTGTLPTTLGLLRNLSYLHLFGNNFTGTIPTDNLQQIQTQPSNTLSILWVHENPELVGTIPCPSSLSPWSAITLTSSSSSFAGSFDGYMDYISDCDSNSNIVCACCSQCY